MTQFAPIAAAKLKAHPATVAKRAQVKATACRCHRNGGTLSGYFDPNTMGDDPSPYFVGPPAPPSTDTGDNFFSNLFKGVGGALGTIANAALDRIAHGSSASAAGPIASAPASNPTPIGVGGIGQSPLNLNPYLYPQSLLPAQQQQPQSGIAGIDSKTLLIGGGLLLAVLFMSSRK